MRKISSVIINNFATSVGQSSIPKLSGSNLSQITKDTVEFSKSPFEVYKADLIRKLQKQKLIDSKMIEKLNSSIDEFDMDCSLGALCENAFSKMGQDLMADKTLDIGKVIEKQKIDLRLEQYLNKALNKDNKKLAQLFKIIAQQDVDPKVLAIKNCLKKDYGVKELYLDNNLELAQSCIKSMKILKKNNIPCPTQIIASRHLTGGINIKDGKLKTIIVPTDINNVFMGPDNLVHLFVHESVHSIQPQLLLFNIQKIPPKYQEVADNVSDYASGNFAHEVHCELYVKKLLDKLSKEEEELFEHLGGNWQ